MHVAAGHFSQSTDVLGAVVCPVHGEAAAAAAPARRPAVRRLPGPVRPGEPDADRLFRHPVHAGAAVLWGWWHAPTGTGLGLRMRYLALAAVVAAAVISSVLRPFLWSKFFGVLGVCSIRPGPWTTPRICWRSSHRLRTIHSSAACPSSPSWRTWLAGLPIREPGLRRLGSPAACLVRPPREDRRALDRTGRRHRRAGAGPAAQGRRRARHLLRGEPHHVHSRCRMCSSSSCRSTTWAGRRRGCTESVMLGMAALAALGLARLLAPPAIAAGPARLLRGDGTLAVIAFEYLTLWPMPVTAAPVAGLLPADRQRRAGVRHPGRACGQPPGHWRFHVLPDDPPAPHHRAATCGGFPRSGMTSHGVHGFAGGDRRTWPDIGAATGMPSPVRARRPVQHSLRGSAQGPVRFRRSRRRSLRDAFSGALGTAGLQDEQL